MTRSFSQWRAPLKAAVMCALVLLASSVAGCATRGVFERGEEATLAGDWDAAVEYYQRAVQEDPDDAVYRVELQRAMLNASRHHVARAREFELSGDLPSAVREYRRAAEYDPGNTQAAGKANELERAIRDRAEASRPPSAIEEMRERARAETQPPLLDPTSGEPLSLEFSSAGLQDILDFIGNATGINVTYDQQFQDRAYSVELDGVTIEEALDQVLTANQYFYKVLNPRTLIVVPDTPQKRAQYEEQVIRTFYISNADVQELATILSQVVRVPQMAVQPQIVPNITANTITVRATTSVAAVIEQVINANDKPRAEIVVDVEILEVNRERARQYGLDLTQYGVGAVYSPDAIPSQPDAPDSLTPPLVRTGDFYLSVPAAILNFLESDTETRLIAKPQLRGQEGATLTLNLGDDIPVPTTAFTPIATGGATVNPLTSFTYRPIGVIVEMTPRVTYENEIILDLEVENSTLGPNISVAGQELPTFGSRKVVTRLRLRDGESNLLAGLLREEDRRSLRGFPGILRLPVIKQLLSANDNSIKQTDIIMVLTPRIVRTHELTQADVSPIHIGTQGNIGLTDAPSLIAPPAGSSGAALPEDGLDADARAEAGAAGSEAVARGRVPDEAVGEDPLAPAAGVSARPAPAPGPSAPMPMFLASSSEPSFGTQIVVMPPDDPLLAGSGPYIVPITVTGASQLSTLTLSLAYDPSVLRVRSVQEGSFMGQDGASVTFVQQVDAVDGRVDLALTRGTDVGAAGSGLVAAVVFEAVAPGTASLTTTGLGLTPGGAPLALGFAPADVTVR